MISNIDLLGVMLVMAVATFLTRALPFMFLSRASGHPLLNYLGDYLPPILMVLLVVYSFKNADMVSVKFLPELIGLFTTMLLHLLWRQPLISITGGTALYMLLVQTDILTTIL
jgi:branched-subunit amino acid transport protein AzlD